MIPVAELQHTPFAFDLERRQALRVWEQAVRSGAAVTLTPRTDERLQLGGTIESETDESFWIELGKVGTDTAGQLQSVCCDGMLELGGVRYMFQTSVLAARQIDGLTAIEIAKPDGLQTVQRRRFLRAELHESVSVRLNWVGSASADPTQLTASLMNLSVDGLACRADRSGADGVSIGDVVQASFSVGGDSEPFVLDAVVKSKIPAGTEGFSVVGLHFLHGNDAQYRLLQAALGCWDGPSRSSG